MNKFVGIALFALISVAYAGDHHAVVDSGLLHRVADVLSHGYGEKVILGYPQKAHLVDYSHSIEPAYHGGYHGGYGGYHGGHHGGLALGHGHHGGLALGHGHGGYAHGGGYGHGHHGGGYGHGHHGGYRAPIVAYRGISHGHGYAHGGHHLGGYHK